MARTEVRFNTQGMSFPLLTSQSGRSVIDASGDLTFIPDMTAEGDIPVDRGVPGMYYAENVMPTAYGWASVGYNTLVNTHAGVTGYFEDIMLVHGGQPSGDDVVSTGERTYFATVNFGGTKILHYVDPTGIWAHVTGIPPWEDDLPLTTAFVNGYSYIMIPHVGLYVFDIGADTLHYRLLDGIEMETIQGITSTAGYLVIYTAIAVFWSSVLDVEDFVPSDTSGAGGGNIQELAGDIVYCKPTQLGFTIYSTSNVVNATYSGNSTYPFEYRGLPGGGGIGNKHLASESDVQGYQYTLGTNGLQKVSALNAAPAYATITDYINGDKFEYFDYVTNQLTTIEVTSAMVRSIQTIANRFIIVSYANNTVPPYEYALVIDTALQRIGKLKLRHTRCFEFKSLLIGSALDAEGAIAFLDDIGKIVSLDLSPQHATAQGVMLLGKLQMKHSNLTQLQEVEIENASTLDNFEMLDMPSMDGRHLDAPVAGYLNAADASSPLKRYLFSNVAASHSLLFKGAFELITILVSLNVHGRR